ncbi:unnamed protein product [Triticum turgidum subsp. durum]|uniref:Uncharacterized protein n=1 Tax=Triticum turgidum subsp. durum TaxID=4567 RepID=A0A9R0PLW2_TRITD|nr:unnamed protein product [Triticum turgidum subsp. durum]
MEKFLVSAATGAMTSLLGKLGTMLTDEYKLLKDVRGDIEFLKDELEAMQKFLLMMADVEEPDHQARLRADAVRELSYDIEDKVDKFMLLVNHESSSKSEGFKELFGKSMKKIASIKTRHKIMKDVKDIKGKVKEISERYARYKIDDSSMPRNEKVDPRICAVYKDTTELVGIDAPRDELVKLLSDEEGELKNQHKVVSIVGAGGFGKTTLARQVYNKLEANFDCRAFVSISRSPDMTKILSSVLSQLRNQDEDYAGVGDPQLLIDHIRNFLKDKRYLIIIDDIWDVPTWKILECAFVKGGHGSRVVSTTRKNDVAKSCCSFDRNLVYKIKPLSDADSAKLFFKRIFGCVEMCPSNLKETSEDILKKCGGLPLAINAISSLLATGKRETEQEWNRVRNSITSIEGKSSDIEAMKYILSLSYFDLPLHLRSCLLYLTLYPEDYEIGRKRLVHRWISEGFIRGKDGDLVDLGDMYFHELVNRSLIQPVKVKYNGKVSWCRVHDTILDFLIDLSHRENFSTLLSNKAKPDRRIRRLSLTGNEDQGIVEQLDISHARSLGVFGPTKQLPSLVKSDALRVLDLRVCGGLGNHQVKDIGKLVQLRYLNIDGTHITELPNQIGGLEYLETLATDPKFPVLPESVSLLKRLARLFVGNGTKLPDGIGNMENLQELEDINPFVQSLNFTEELGKLINLRKLKISWHTIKSDDASHKEKLVSSLCKLDNCNLRILYIVFYLEEEDSFIKDLCFPSLNCVRNICLSRGEIHWIAKWLLSLANLQKLYITSGEIEQQDLEMIGSISTLVRFDVWYVCEGPIISSSSGFQQLQKFTLSFCNGFMFEAGAMPNLRELHLIFHLHELKSAGSVFDFGIQHLASLANIHVLIHCNGVTAADVEAVERALKSMAEANPNRPALEISKICEGDMLPDE